MLSFPDFCYKQIAIHTSGGSSERIRFRADNIIIEDKRGEIIFQHSCHRLFALFIIGETTLTTPMIYHAVRFGFPIIIMNRNLKMTAKINSGAEGNTLLRRKQYLLSSSRQLEISQALSNLKIHNQANLITQLRYLSKQDRKIRDELLNCNVYSAQSPQELLGIEGNASKHFFNTYFRPLDWKRREPRCRRDINNFLLDIIDKNVDGLVYLTLEPHLRIFAAYADIDEHELRGKYTFDSGREAFDFATKKLEELMMENGFGKDENGLWKR